MFDSLLRPTQIRTNNDAGLLRLIACVCMCIDHAGKMLFPELTWMRLVGRLFMYVCRQLGVLFRFLRRECAKL